MADHDHDHDHDHGTSNEPDVPHSLGYYDSSPITIMDKYEWDFRTLDCFECFKAEGKMCVDRDYESMIVATGSSNNFHGVCCKPGYEGQYCNNEEKNRCSPPVFDNNINSKWVNVTTDNMNYQFFAFCPGINEKVCGISQNEDKYNFTLPATLEKKTFKTNELKHTHGTASTMRADACHYMLKAELTED